MAKLTRADIRRIIGENCTEEMESAIIALHLAVVDPLKDDLQRAKETAEKLPAVQKELDDLKTANKGQEDYKAKYDALVKENADKAAKTAKTDALRSLLKDIGVSDKRLESVLKISDVDGIKLNDKGEIEDAETLKKNLKSEWADFITTRTVRGSNPETPPVNGEVPKSRADIYKTDEHGRFVMDAAQRQAALSQLIADEQQKG